jgi:soluble lytic murein transglycosylase
VWGSGARRAIACGGAISAAGLADEGTAAADLFRYVDRDGIVHQFNAAGSPPAAPRPGSQPGTDGEYPFAAAVQEAAGLYSLPVELLLAVITIESGFEPKAVSPRGAMGLMQVMPVTAAEMRIADPFDPRDNILGGARYLRIVLNGAGGDVAIALGSYNAGAGASQRYGGVPPYRDTHEYIASVVRFYRMYQARGPGFAAAVAAAIRGRKGALSALVTVAPAPPETPKPVAVAPSHPAMTESPAGAPGTPVGAERVASPNKAVISDDRAGVRPVPSKKPSRPRRPKGPRRSHG